ncbi:MAG: prolyl aminopeptidase [Pseudomonadota bacterium]
MTQEDTKNLANVRGYRAPYPTIEPYHTGTLDVGDGHTLYYEQSGNPDGKPVVALHGGPGGGSSPGMRRFFNPDVYHIILFDQRGAGKSTPHASLDANTTQDLIGDIEILREALQIRRWQVFGGSWGSTLALAYAEAHPERVTELVLRGIFMLRPEEIAWFYQHGASELYPDQWEHYLEPIPLNERSDLLGAYHKRLISADEDVRLEAARAWSTWEGATSFLYPDRHVTQSFGETRHALAMARIECHYFMNGGFMAPNQLLDNIDRVRNIPAVIVQGRYDVVCPPVTAWMLHKAWPEARFELVPDAGHSAFEPGNASALVTATDRFASGQH